MEKLQGPINPCFLVEPLDVGGLEQGFAEPESLRLEDEEEAQYFSLPSLNDKMPFLQMLQCVETPPLLPFQEPTFQAILGLQPLKRQCDEHILCMPEIEIKPRAQILEVQSCVTHLHSSNKSEKESQKQPNSAESGGQEEGSCYPKPINQETHLSKTNPLPTRERKKRKRTRPAKNKEQVECQRMTHIAVERNRRRQMNNHLNALRSLMPSSYVQRGDQASIIGGAIDFVKELEQMLQSFEVRKRMRKAAEEGCETSSSSASMELNEPPQTAAAEVEVTVIQTHVNLKIQCQRKPGQLLKAIVAMEDLRLSVLHLNVTSLQSSVHYCFNLKIEDDCELRSADEVASAIHHIFRIINGS